MKYNLDPNQILLLAQGESVEVNGEKIQLAVVEEVTNQSPVKSLKYEDCAERVKPEWYVTSAGNINEFNGWSEKNKVPTERTAKQVLAFCQLLTIMHDANGGEWIPKSGELVYSPFLFRSIVQFTYMDATEVIASPIYFKSQKIAEQVLMENRQLFLDFLGIEEVANG